MRRRPSWRIVVRRQCRQWRQERNSVLVSGSVFAAFLGLNLGLRALGFGVR